MTETLRNSIPNCYYTDEKYTNIEIDKIFKREWIFACHKSQIGNKGDYTTLNYCNLPVFLVNTGEGVRAFYNTCPHRGHTLVDGNGSCKQHITCPYHAWSFNLDGSFASAPGKHLFTQNDFEGIKLKELFVKETRGLVFICEDNLPTDELLSAVKLFEEDFGVNFESYKFHKKYEYTVNCNWKILVDNYLECYHCKPCHPSFVDLMKVSTYKINTYNKFSHHEADEGRSNNTAYHFDDSDPERSKKFNGWFLFPNLTVNIFPGRKGILIFYIFPIDSEKCYSICDYLFDEEVTEQDINLMDWESEVLSSEDNEKCEGVQRGLSSGAFTHCNLLNIPTRSDISEHAIVHFHEYIERMIKG